MKLPRSGFSTGRKFLAFILFICILAAADYALFLDKSKKIELFDELSYRLGSARVTITKLEYLLDMFVVARRFEGTTVDMIKGDVERLDESMSEIFDNPKYAKLFKTNAILSGVATSVTEDWQTIKYEIARLNGAMSQDEVMLIHNAVDMHTIIITEKADRLLSAINESRGEVFQQYKALALESIIGFIVIALIASLIFYRRIIYPLGASVFVARRVATGELESRFSTSGRGIVSSYAEELNYMLDSMAESHSGTVDKCMDLSKKLINRTGQLEKVNTLAGLASRSLSLDEIYACGVKEVVSAGGADAAALYLNDFDSDLLRLKASSGFNDMIYKEASEISHRELDGVEREFETRLFNQVDDYPGSALARFLSSNGYSLLLSVPVLYNGNTAGFLYIAYFDRNSYAESALPFFKAVSSGIGVYNGYVELFHDEHTERRFLERVINQVPLGIAVFDRSGVCVMFNSALKYCLGADPKYALIGRYSFYDDEVLETQGMVPAIEKSYDGFITEFLINYNPTLVTRYDFSGATKKLKIRSYPIYDSGGEISNIMLLYEDLSKSVEESPDSGEKV